MGAITPGPFNDPNLSPLLYSYLSQINLDSEDAPDRVEKDIIAFFKAFDELKGDKLQKLAKKRD